MIDKKISLKIARQMPIEGKYKNKWIHRYSDEQLREEYKQILKNYEQGKDNE